MDWPIVAIVLLTYDRFEYAEKTLLSLFDNISYSGNLHLHVADDGSSEGYIEALELDLLIEGVTKSNSQRGGYGVNYNLAMQTVHQIAEIVLPLEDDWELLRPLNLDPFVEALRAPEAPFGCIRMGYVGFTQELRAKFISHNNRHWLLLDPESSEPHVWAGHPRLETREWQRKVGPWPEDQPDPGSTEFLVARRPEAREGVVWPIEFIKPSGDLFAHIGTVQARKDQIRETILS